MSDLVYYGGLAFLGVLLVASIIAAHQFLREVRIRRLIRALREFGVYAERMRGAFGDLAVSAEYATRSLKGIISTPSFQVLRMDHEANRYATRSLPPATPTPTGEEADDA